MFQLTIALNTPGIKQMIVTIYPYRLKEHIKTKAKESEIINQFSHQYWIGS